MHHGEHDMTAMDHGAMHATHDTASDDVGNGMNQQAMNHDGKI